MMTIIDKLIDTWIKEKTYLSICFLTLFLLTCTWTLPDSVFAILKSMPQITTATLGKVAISLFLLSLALASSLLAFLRKPNIKDYDLINPPGFLKHRRTGKYYCQPCLQTRHIASELSVVKKDEMFCRNCKEPYPIDASFIITDKILTEAFDDACNELMLKNKNG